MLPHIKSSTPRDADEEEEVVTCFDANGDIVATYGLPVPLPWTVMESKSFEGI